MTPAAVSALYAAQVLKASAAGTVAGFDARQATRTLVHAQLQAESPVPYPLPPSALAAGAPGAAGAADLASRKAAMHASVSQADQVAFQAIGSTASGCRDAHHYAQRQQQAALWVQADALLKAAGI